MRITLYFLFLFIFGSITLVGQTTLINPTQEGGFELAGGFSGNGWTVVNSTINSWSVSSVASPYTGSNSAFISADAGITYSYNANASSTSHFYRQVTVPAGQTTINLKFQCKTVGEPFFDQLLVYTAPTNIIPAADIPDPSTNQITGATLVYTHPGDQAAYNEVSVNLPASLSGTSFNLIFTWQNDISASNGSPASIDNISLITSGITPLNGTYTINNLLSTSTNLPTSGANFTSFTDAISYLNTNGVSGPVIFNVSSNQTFIESPQIINATGTSSNTITFQKNGTGANPVFIGINGIGSLDAAIKINGADYITFDGIDLKYDQLNNNVNSHIEFGYFITNFNSINGANNNMVKNCSITLNPNNSNSIAVYQNFTQPPSSTDGCNNNNTIDNVTVVSSFNGILLTANNNYPDVNNSILNCNIGNLNQCLVGNSISSAQVSGIWLVNQKNVFVSGNNIMGLIGRNNVNGIFCDRANTNTTINNNKIINITCSNTSSISFFVTGIRVNSVSSGTHNVKVYNNYISQLISQYNGASSSSRVIRGIATQVGISGTSTSLYEISYNTITIDGSISPNISSTCFESGSTFDLTGPQIKVRNNIFYNSTFQQSASAAHYCYSTAATNLIGSPGSISNYNNFYISNISNGFVGNGASSVNYSTLVNWSNAFAQDQNSLTVDPIFDIPNDYHILQPLLNSVASPSSQLPYILTDIEGDIRTSPNSDIGADEFTPYIFDLQLVSVLTPDTIGCFSNNETVQVVVRNKTGGDLDFQNNPVNIIANVTGASTQNIFFPLNTNSFNEGIPLAPFAYDTIPIGTVDLSAYGNHQFKFYSNWNADQNRLNDTIKNFVRTNISPVSLPQSLDFSGFNGSNITTLYNGWKEATGLTPTGNTSSWYEWAGFSNPNNINARVTLTGNSTIAWLISPKFVANQFSLLTYKAAYTQPSSIGGLPGIFGADDQFLIKISTDCGASFQTIDTIYPLEITNTFRQFYLPLDAYNGQNIIIAFFATDGSIINGNCDLHLDDINITNTPASDISIIQQNQPTVSNCYSTNESVVIKLKNTGPLPINFSNTQAFVKTAITGVFNLNYTDTIDSGTLLKDSVIIINLGSSLNLTIPGQYYFTSTVLLGGGDVNASNDTLRKLINSQNPTASFPTSLATICNGDSILLQPQVSINGNGSDNNLTFTSNEPPIDIPDSDPNGVSSSVTVSGLSGFATQLVNVTIDSLVHTFVGDLVISLMAPDSSIMILSQSNGSGGDDYLNTVFSPTSSNSIVFASAPFTGTYSPQESFDSLTGPNNGVWRLLVSDISGGDVGTLFKWSITFNEPNVLGTYSYSPTNSLIQSDSLDYLAFPSLSQVYTLTVTDARACSATASFSVNVIQRPHVEIGNDTIICEGIPLTLDAGIGFVSYSWNTGDTTQQISPTFTNVYMVEVTDTNNCSNRDTLTVIIYPNPTIELGNDTTIPFGTTILLAPGFGYQSYAWSNGSIAEYVEVNLPGTFTVAVTDYNGCVSRDTVTVNMPPFNDLSLLQIAEPIQKSCYLGNEQFIVTLKNTGNRVHDFTLNPVTIDANVSGPIPQNLTLQIISDSLMPDSSRDYLVTTTLKLSRPGAYSINSQLIQLAPDSNSTNESAFVQITSTNPEINMLVTNPSICEGDSVQLQATSTVSGLTQPAIFESGNVAISIPDSDPTGVTSSIVVSNVPFAANQLISVTIDSIVHPSVGDLILTLISPAGTPVYLSVNNGNGANFIGTTFNLNAQNAISSGSAPFSGEFMPQASFNSFNGAANGNWTLLVKDISDQNTDIGTIYSWKLSFPQQNTVASQVWSPTTNISNSTALSPFVYPIQTTNYYLTVTDANACSSVDSVVVNVNPAPSVTFELSVNSTCVNSGLMQLDGISPAGGSFSGNGLIAPDSFDPSIAGAGQHIIIYSITDNSSCSNSAQDTITVGTCDGLNEINANDLSVYPNPFSNQLDVVYNDNDFNVIITDALGRIVLLKENCTQKTTLNTVQLEPGIYFICLINKQKQTVIKKLIKN